MDLPTFVAQVAAITYLSVGAGMLFDKAHYKKLFDDIMHDMSALYLGGFIALIAGFAIVTHHNVWDGSTLEVLVTIIGWLALIKGVMLLAFPTTVVGLTKNMVKSKNLGNLSFIVIALGLIFGYFGFMV